MADGPYREVAHSWNGRYPGMKPWFDGPQQSHEHSLRTLNTFYEFDDFMESVGSVLDLGCGAGLDMLWWSTRTTRDVDNPQPLNIRSTGVDLNSRCDVRHPLITYRPTDFESDMGQLADQKFDLLWCHDAFQHVHKPYDTLIKWRERTGNGGMLVLIVPQTTGMEHNRQRYEALDGCHYHWTLPNLIYMLAVTGWDCAGGFFLKKPDDPWIHAVVYKSTHLPMPMGTRWYALAEKALLPKSASDGVHRRGYLSQQDLILPWLDKSLITYLNY